MTLLIGYAASVLSTVAFLPQAISVIRTRNVESISLMTYIIFVISVILWLAYGIILMDFPIIISNLVCTVLGGIIMFYKIADVYSEAKAKSYNDYK